MNFVNNKMLKNNSFVIDLLVDLRS